MARRPVTSKEPIIGLSLLAILGNQYERPRASTCGRLFVTYSGIISNSNSMKKILIGVLFGLLIIPQVSFAVWWNPFTWFRKTPAPAPVVTPVTLTPTSLSSQAEVVEKKEEQKPVSTQKKPVTTTYSTDVVLWVEAINSRVASYQKYSSLLKDAVARDQGYLKKLESYPIDDYLMGFIFASSLTYKVELEEIAKKLDLKIVELKTNATTLNTQSSLDTAVWNPKLKDFDNYLLTSLSSAVKSKMEHEADLAEANNYIKLLTQSNSGSSSSYYQNSSTTQFESELNEYNKKLEEMKEQLVKEYTSAGGYWTSSQLEANAVLKLKEMGIKPPTSLSGSPDVGSYSSTKCNSLNGGFDCYGSNGARTQVIPMGNGQFEIRGW